MEFSKYKEDALYIGAIFFLTLIFLNSWIGLTSHTLGDLIVYFDPREELLYQSITEYGDIMPLWSPYFFGGDPLLAKSAFFNIFYLPSLLIFIIGPFAALKWTIMINFFLAGAFMYALMRYLTASSKIGLISALVYMFNGFFLFTAVKAELMESVNAYPLLPLLMLFTIRAFKEKEWLSNTIFAGITLALMIIGSSGIFFLYATLALFLYFTLSLLGRSMQSVQNRIIKATIIGVILVCVFAGLSAFKLLPVYEYQQEYGVRGNLDWESASTRTFSPGEYFRELIEPSIPHFAQEQSNKIGIVAFILALVAIWKMPKNRNWMFFAGLIIISLLLTSGTILLKLLWQYYPGWSGMRYANRALFLFVFSASCLAGLGAGTILDLAKKKFNSNSAENFAFYGLAALIVIDLAVLGVGGFPNPSTQPQNFETVLKSNEVMNFLAEQNGTFRIHTLETRGIDWGTEFYTVPLKLENIMTYDSNWYPEYVNRFFQYSTNPANSAKYWGIMNVKYVTAQSSVNITGLKLLQRFNDCKICFPEQAAIQKAWGPYLYENEEFMPRAYLINNSILIVGKKNEARNMMYAILNEEAFDPRKSVIILGKEKIEDYTTDELNHYQNVILLQGSVNQGAVLAEYKGTLMPDIRTGETSFSLLQLKENLREGKYEPIADTSIRIINFNKKEIMLPEYKGFLVMSEKYALFNGWKAETEQGEKDLLLANGVITAMYIENDGKIKFTYFPNSYKLGMIISLSTLALLLAYFLNSLTKKFKKAQAVQSP